MKKAFVRSRSLSAGQLALSLIGVVLVIATARWAWRTGADWRVLGAGLAFGLFYGVTDRLRFAPDALPPRETAKERLGGWIFTLAAVGVIAALEWPFGYDNVAGFIVFFGPLCFVTWVARRYVRSRRDGVERDG